jgi:carboxyl-terminal processing protease
MSYPPYLLVIIVKEKIHKKNMSLRLLLVVLSGISIFASCRKNDSGGSGSINEDILRDSTLALTRDVYLWNDQIPTNFNARAYEGPPEIMDAIRQYSTEPGFSSPVDHYSFAMKQQEWDNLSNGIISDFGLSAFFFSDTDLRVRLVEEASPAGKAGIRRGWKFVKVAGSNDISSGNTDFLVQNIYESGSTAFTFEKPDGSTVDITLSSETYQENPVVLDSVYTTGAKKAGYIVFNSFLGDTGKVINEITSVFDRFVAENVTDVIVDLRYNGGGYVSVSEALANFLIKPAANGSIMMTQQYNENYSDLNEVTMFRKRGALNVNNIYFVVTDNTASASELLINNLKPYMNVKLVGPEPTYGKPVGFFPIPVGDWYIFPVSFRSTNGQNQGNYFDGIAVDQLVNDGLDKDWGDQSEAALNSVLSYIGTGSFTNGGLDSRLDMQKVSENKVLNRNFKGAIAK